MGLVGIMGQELCCAGTDDYVSTPLRDMQAVRKVKPTTLDDMTDKQQEYYKKCMNLVFKMSMAIKSQDGTKAIEHDGDHKNTWNYVEQIAETCQDSFFDFAQRLVDSIESFNDEDNETSNGWDMTAVIRGQLMPANIAKDRVDNDNWLRLVNVGRACIVYNCFKELYAMLLILAKYNQNCCGFEIVQIRNQGHIVPSLRSKGWSNIVVSVKPVQFEKEMKEERIMKNLGCTEDEEDVLNDLKMDKSKDEDDEKDDDEEFLNLPGHVCELQLIHRASWNDYQDAYNSFL